MSALRPAGRIIVLVAGVNIVVLTAGSIVMIISAETIVRGTEICVIIVTILTECIIVIAEIIVAIALG
jgi:hypothetical protein